MNTRTIFTTLFLLSFLFAGCGKKKQAAFDPENFGLARRWIELQGTALLRECDGHNEALIKRELDALNKALAALKERKVSWRASISSISNTTVNFSLHDAEPSNIQFATSIKCLDDAAKLRWHGEFRGGWTPWLSMAAYAVPEEVKLLRHGDLVVFEAVIRKTSAQTSGFPPRPSFEILLAEPVLRLAR